MTIAVPVQVSINATSPLSTIWRAVKDPSWSVAEFSNVFQCSSVPVVASVAAVGHHTLNKVNGVEQLAGAELRAVEPVHRERVCQ